VSRKTWQPERPAEPVPGSEKHLVAWRLLQPLEHLLHTLRRPDEHGNRTLFADHLLIAHLVAFFSPALKSLRRIEDVFGHPGARRKYGLPRLPHSTVSDAHALFDPALLTPLIADLRSRVGVGPHEPRLDELLRKLLATDGTFFTLAPRVLWALYTKPNGTARQPRKQNQHGNVRVDVQFNPPRRTGGRAGDGGGERRSHAGVPYVGGKPPARGVLRAGPGLSQLPDGG
jgi:hypothetical protein